METKTINFRYPRFQSPFFHDCILQELLGSLAGTAGGLPEEVGGNEKSLTSEASRDGVSRIAIAREVAPRI